MSHAAMFASLPAVEASIDQLIGLGRHSDALANMVVGVHNHYKAPGVAHHHLYYPLMDRQIRQLSQLLEAACPLDTPAGEPSRNTLILATELYQVGGHSRVVEDFVREVESPVIVLTDVFQSYRKEAAHLNWLHDTYPDTPVIALSQRDLWSKCRALLQLTRRLNPQRIFYFNHHQDPLPFVGTLGHAASRKTLVHHADHNPSLGITLPGMAHADFTDELAGICRSQLHVPAQVLPLYVPDSGLKSFSDAGAAFSVVTSGTQVKFARSGELALQRIAQAVLGSTRGRFFHIGPLDAEWAAEIRAHLEQNDIDPGRFQPLGPVNSLWQSLRELDAHVYLGSAPVGGGRAAIEAQGCGYPLVFHRVGDSSSLLAADSIYADPQLGWTTLDELSALLKAMGGDLPRLSAQARALYEQRFSREEFLRVLGGF